MIEAQTDGRAGRRRALVDAVMASAAAPLILVGGYVAYFLFRVRFAERWPLAPWGDAAILFERSRLIVELGDYPARMADGTMAAVFPYPPAAVLLFRALAMSPAGFMGIWVLLIVAGLVLTLRGPLVQEATPVRRRWVWVGAAALVLAGSAVEWDLRNANSNVVYLGLILAGYTLIRRAPGLAGTLIGLSVSLKLFSGLLLVWLAVRGATRAAVAGAATVALLWGVAPVAVFGVTGAAQLYSGWFEQIRIVADPAAYQLITDGGGPPLVPVRRAVMALTGEGPRGSTVGWGVTALQVIWTAVVGWYGWRALREPGDPAPSRAALADWTVLLLAPLPFNPWLEPYHAVPVVVAVMLCLVVVADERLDARTRGLALVPLVVSPLLRLSGAPFEFRGLSLYVQFLVLVASLGAIRSALVRVRR